MSKRQLFLEKEKLLISGPIVFSNVLNLRKEGDGWIKQCGEKELFFDFTKVEQSDSSVLALMISWKRQCNRFAKKAVFINLPKSLIDMAEACGVKHLLLDHA
jgi:ABC-type transporter Mla MlaB component